MKRKTFLKSTILGAVGAGTMLNSCASNSESNNVASPAIQSGKKYNWRMVTTWPPKFPVLGEGAEMFAEMVKTMSGGRLNIKVYGAGELVPALEAFGSVSEGTAEMGSGAAYYWIGKSAAAQFFASIPFGMNAQQLTTWMISGGGYQIWKEVYEPFNLIPLLGGNSGVQMGGWFNKEINTVSDLKGLKMRIPGIAGTALKKAGGAPVLLPAGEIYTSLERGVIDACEWIGPYHDYKMGFNKIAKYYYTPGWHEPGTQLEFFVNKTEYEKLPADLQEIVLTASYRIHSWVLAEFESQNATWLEKIEAENKVEIKKFPKPVLNQLKIYSNEAVKELIGSDAMAKKAYDSFSNFKNKMSKWAKLTEQTYYNDLQA